MARPSPDQETVTTYADLVALFARDGVPQRADEERERILVALNKDTLKTTIIVIWPSEQTLLQVVAPMPFQVPPERREEALVAIARINHALTLPGFNYDADSGVLYFRLVQPRGLAGSLTTAEIRRAFNTVTQTASRFAPTLDRLAKGEIGADAVLQEAGVSP